MRHKPTASSHETTPSKNMKACNFRVIKLWRDRQLRNHPARR